MKIFRRPTRSRLVCGGLKAFERLPGRSKYGDLKRRTSVSLFLWLIRLFVRFRFSFLTSDSETKGIIEGYILKLLHTYSLVHSLNGIDTTQNNQIQATMSL